MSIPQVQLIQLILHVDFSVRQLHAEQTEDGSRIGEPPIERCKATSSTKTLWH